MTGELGERGLDPGTCCVVAVDAVSAASERQLHLGLGRRSVPHLLLRRATLLYALMPVTEWALDVFGSTARQPGNFGNQRTAVTVLTCPDSRA